MTLKKRFTEEPVLMMPDQTWPFQIESDASKYASGAVLTQMDSNEDWHLVAFMLKTFTDTEWQYKIYDWELLGIICALKKWQHYIQGSRHDNGTHWPQEFNLLQKGTKTFWLTSTLGIIFIQIQHQTSAFTWTQTYSIRCSVKTTRSLSRQWRNRRTDLTIQRHVHKSIEYRTIGTDNKCQRFQFWCQKHYLNTVRRGTRIDQKWFERLEIEREGWTKSFVL